MKILDFFYFRPKADEDSSESGGIDLNCHVFEYLMMYLFDCTDITKLPNSIFQIFCLHGELVTSQKHVVLV